jgi:antitoxin (DNA-binding transcriptional repressor) of toxin-antitoxin stability system
MKRASVRDLHLNTSAILTQVARGQVFVIEKNRNPIAELRPLQEPPPARRMPNRERWIARLPRVADTATVLEQIRS